MTGLAYASPGPRPALSVYDAVDSDDRALLFPPPWPGQRVPSCASCIVHGFPRRAGRHQLHTESVARRLEELGHETFVFTASRRLQVGETAPFEGRDGLAGGRSPRGRLNAGACGTPRRGGRSRPTWTKFGPTSSTSSICCSSERTRSRPCRRAESRSSSASTTPGSSVRRCISGRGIATRSRAGPGGWRASGITGGRACSELRAWRGAGCWPPKCGATSSGPVSSGACSARRTRCWYRRSSCGEASCASASPPTGWRCCPTRPSRSPSSRVTRPGRSPSDTSGTSPRTRASTCSARRSRGRASDATLTLLGRSEDPALLERLEPRLGERISYAGEFDHARLAEVYAEPRRRRRPLARAGVVLAGGARSERFRPAGDRLADRRASGARHRRQERRALPTRRRRVAGGRSSSGSATRPKSSCSRPTRTRPPA